MALTGLQLRCPLSEARSIEVAAPAGGVVAGQMGAVNDLVGVYATDAAEGEGVAFIYQAPRIIVPCLASPVSTGYAAGEKVYFDASGAEVTETSTSNTLCGVVTVTASDGDETVEIALDGMLGIVA